MTCTSCVGESAAKAETETTAYHVEQGIQASNAIDSSVQTQEASSSKKIQTDVTYSELQNKEIAEEDTNQGNNKPSTIFSENNPIDTYFDTFTWNQGYSTATMNQFGFYLKDAWKNEMIHAYDLLLEKANPKTASPSDNLRKSRDAFIEYVENDSWIEPYAMASNAFGDTEENGAFTGTYSESIVSGTIIGQLVLGEQWSHYKEQTLYLFDILHELKVEPNFIFVPSEELKQFFANE